MGLVVVVPTTSPQVVIRINNILSRDALSVPVGEHYGRAANMPVRGPLEGIGRIHIAVEGTIRLTVANHDHFSRTLDLRILHLADDIDVPTQTKLVRPGRFQSPIVKSIRKTGRILDSVSIITARANAAERVVKICVP